ncbi:alpha-hydroxy-acid oxidizing protein [bacterium]|nr:alpha-hydroxy-acid oxidizing protein [bacterium]
MTRVPGGGAGFDSALTGPHPRRRFLAWLAASPLVSASAAAQVADESFRIKEAGEAINVFDLEAAARRNMRSAHWGYLATGVLDDATVQANRDGFAKWGVTARRMVDTSSVNIDCGLFGEAWSSPVALAPVSSQRAFHQDGERPAAQAARTRNALLILSSLTTISIETVIRDRDGPVWFQLYPTNDRAIARALVERADKAGASAIVLTVDLLAGGARRETMAALGRSDAGNCAQCHEPGSGMAGFLKRKAMFDRLDLAGVRSVGDPSMTWEFVTELRGWTRKKILVKGIMSPDDAERALAFGADGVIVSNHGGRAEESLVSTIEVLPSIRAKIGTRAPILLDGGVRRGVDVFKALALGADMVCIGRPYVWGSAAFGREGVEAAMRLIDDELVSAMEQAGVTRLAGVKRDRLVRLS